THDGDYAFTVNGTSGALSASAAATLRVRTGENAVVSTGWVWTEGKPLSVAYDPKTRRVFAAIPDLHEVAVLDVAGQRLVARVATPSPISVAVPPGGGIVIVGSRAGYVSVIDPARAEVMRRVPLPVPVLTPGCVTDQLAPLAGGDVLVRISA